MRDKGGEKDGGEPPLGVVEKGGYWEEVYQGSATTKYQGSDLNIELVRSGENIIRYISEQELWEIQGEQETVQRNHWEVVEKGGD